MEENEGDLEVSENQAGMLVWKIEEMQLEPEEVAEASVSQLLQSVTEVRNDYQNLRRELGEVQALQRELATRLRQQLQQVQGKFSSLRERLAGPPPH